MGEDNKTPTATVSNNNSNTNNRFKGRGGFNRNKGFKSQTTKTGAKDNKFKGKVKELEGFYFDAVKYNQADEYIKTVEAIAEYIGINYDQGDDCRRAIEDLKMPDIPKPKKPASKPKKRKGVEESKTEGDKTLAEDTDSDDDWEADLDMMIFKKETN